jgi:Carbohydrate-binding family 9
MIVQAIFSRLAFSSGLVILLLTDLTPFPVYRVKRLEGSITIDGNWNKRAWEKVKPVRITHDIIDVPKFHPETEVKMCYDTGSLYIIFLVQDRYVRSVTTQLGGPVWKDAAVEFFFCTDTSRPDRYFNLEINCGGTPLLGYGTVRPAAEDIHLIRIAHSLPQVVDPEMAGPISWTIECQIPLAMLAKYAGITKPAKGVSWKANFCKIAENNTNPHHMTWSPIDDPHPNFHMPQYFGSLQFE